MGNLAKVYQVEETGAAVAPDRQLLARFVAERDEAAFTALVERHGPLVLGVCRRMLRHTQDAEDAFQATFLVLAWKAARVRYADRLGNWLYGVACRSALEARAAQARAAREQFVAELPDVAMPAADEEVGELLAILDREVTAL